LKSNFKPGNDSVPDLGRTALPCFPLPLFGCGFPFPHLKSGPDAYAIKGNAVFCAKAAAASPDRKPPAAAFRRGRSEFGLNWVRQQNKMTARFRGSSCFVCTPGMGVTL